MSQPFSVKANACWKLLYQSHHQIKREEIQETQKSLILFGPQIRDDFIQTATSPSHDTYQIASVIVRFNSALSDTINIS